VIEDVITASKNRKPILLEKIGRLEKGFRVEKLMSTINEIILENLKFSAEGKDYLEQIETTLGKLREAVIIIGPHEEIKLSNDAFKLLINTTSDPNGDRIDHYIQGTAMI